jgi:hypothetical protein
MCKLESEQGHKEAHLVNYPIGVNGRKYDVQAFEIGSNDQSKRQLQGIKRMNGSIDYLSYGAPKL